MSYHINENLKAKKLSTEKDKGTKLARKPDVERIIKGKKYKFYIQKIIQNFSIHNGTIKN